MVIFAQCLLKFNRDWAGTCTGLIFSSEFFDCNLNSIIYYMFLCKSLPKFCARRTNNGQGITQIMGKEQPFICIARRCRCYWGYK